MKKKKKLNTVLLILIFAVGLSLVLYPSVSNYINEMHASKAISDYSASVSKLDQEQYEKIIQEARDYNSALYQRTSSYVLNGEQKFSYQKMLNIGGNGIMGYIEIPSISVALPIYHGTDDDTLQVAVGHLEWTSLPVGGENTHCVLSGHRGLPSAKLFTNLDKLVEGDVFMLRVLNEVLTYEVDQILTVLPANTSELQVEKGKDYCTLVTCTPYGINTHRLLVRGHRIENTPEAISVHITAEAMQIEPLVVASIAGVPSLILMVIFVFLGGKKKRSDQGGKTNEQKAE